MPDVERCYLLVGMKRTVRTERIAENQNKKLKKKTHYSTILAWTFHDSHILMYVQLFYITRYDVLGDVLVVLYV